MVRVTDEEVTEAYHNFCEASGLEPPAWRSLFNFSTFIGYSIIKLGNIAEDDSCCLVSDDAARKIRMLCGPHVEVILKAYRARNASWPKKVYMTLRKAGHFITLFSSGSYHAIKDFYREF